jgi:dihydrodipicolinate synthase/N-acetylneuraminate lyase
MLASTELKGIIVPIVTPVTDNGGVDYDGLRRVIRYVLDGGVHAVFALGGTGNFCSFTAEERFEVARTTVQEVNGRVPVLVGCMDSSTVLAVRNVKLACDAGADAVVVEPPFYYPCTDDDVIAHYTAVAQASQVPVIVYNIPEANKVHIPVPLLEKLAAIPRIAGIKDSTSDFVYFQELLTTFGESHFRLIQGQETLVGASFLLGAHGAILSIGNVVPRLCVRLCEAGCAGRLDETMRLQGKLMTAFSVLSRPAGGSAVHTYYAHTVSSFFGGLHCALNILGLCDRIVTPPFSAPSQSDFDRIRATLDGLRSTGDVP